MAWLLHGEKISKISLFVLTQLTNVTDGQTDGQTDTACRHIPRLCIASRGKNAVIKAIAIVPLRIGSVHLFVCLSVCPSVCCQNACRKTRFSKKN